jgi:two-component system chemotaxis response regulator CheY
MPISWMAHYGYLRGYLGMRFLIIDDSITMRRIIANILGRLGYPEVVHASNGREALDKLATEAIDIVVTDWYMPEMNGLDFVRALRTTPATSHIPIVIVTANAASDDIQQALELGVNSYILKPFTVETMRDKIAALLAPTTVPAVAGGDGDGAGDSGEEAGNAGETVTAAAPAAEVTPEPVPVAEQAVPAEDTVEVSPVEVDGAVAAAAEVAEDVEVAAAV